MKPYITVSQMAKDVNLSRARFYQLIASGFFPSPNTDDRCNRPYYNEASQRICHHCKDTGVGVNMKVNMFYGTKRSREK